MNYLAASGRGSSFGEYKNGRIKYGRFINKFSCHSQIQIIRPFEMRQGHYY